MTVPYSPLSIANNFLEQYGDQGGIEHMKLQKLVYCSYGWWLAINGMDAVRLTDEGPEIWKHGPVFNSLYQVLKVFGRTHIAAPQSTGPFEEAENIDHDDDHTRSFVRWIWSRYGHLSSFALSEMTHKPGTPWHRVATENNFRIAFNTRIPDKYIFEEFNKLRNVNIVSSGNDDGRELARA